MDFHLLDVFTSTPFGGNQLAVFPDPEPLETAAMQKIAREINFSETVFVYPPEDQRCDFKLRIFSPAAELPIAGHPTVGTAFVLAWEGRIEGDEGIATTVFEEGVGPVPVEIELAGGAPRRAMMEQPLPEVLREVENREAIAAMVSLEPEDLAAGLPVEALSCGVPFLYVPLTGLEAAGRARLVSDRWEALRDELPAEHVVVLTRETVRPTSAVHARMFAPAFGIVEDPATGAAAGPLGAYLVRHGLVPIEGGGALFTEEQGFEMGRPSLIEVEVTVEGGAGGTIRRVRVGGEAVSIGRARLNRVW